MTTVSEIPLVGTPERFSILIGQDTYRFRIHYADAPRVGWMLDIANSGGYDLICGIPLLPGYDLLGPYLHRQIPGMLFVKNDEDFSASPPYVGLGKTSHLYLVTNP